MKEQLRKIEREFAALRADVMIGEKDSEKQLKRIADLDEQEKQAREQLFRDVDEMKALFQEVREWAQILGIRPIDSVSLLILREARRIHYHEDERLKKKPKKD